MENRELFINAFIIVGVVFTTWLSYVLNYIKSMKVSMCYIDNREEVINSENS